MKTILYIPSQQNKVYFVLIIKWKKKMIILLGVHY